MILQCLGSSSKGNCYLLTSETEETLILDCGIHIMEIKKGLNFNLKRVVGAICTHAHKDHSRSVQALRDIGIRVIAPYESGNVKRMRFHLGSFEISAFDLPHDGCWNNGFLINADGQKLLYMTDLEYCRYTFKNQRVNHFLIECNHCKRLLDFSIPNFEHKVKGHAELDTTKGIIQGSKSNALRTIILCHLGGYTADQNQMISEIREVAGDGIEVDIAEKGKSWDLKDIPF